MSTNVDETVSGLTSVPSVWLEFRRLGPGSGGFSSLCRSQTCTSCPCCGCPPSTEPPGGEEGEIIVTTIETFKSNSNQHFINTLKINTNTGSLIWNLSKRIELKEIRDSQKSDRHEDPNWSLQSVPPTSSEKGHEMKAVDPVMTFSFCQRLKVCIWGRRVNAAVALQSRHDDVMLDDAVGTHL